MKIQKKITWFLILFISFFLISQAGYAQKEGKKMSFGFAVEAGTPIGDKDFKEYYKFGGGLSLRFSYLLGPGYATLGAGFAALLPDNIADQEELKAAVIIPIKAGYKYVFAKKIFAHGEVGYGPLTLASVDDDDEIVKDSYSGFIYSATLGGNLGSFEIGLKYESLVGLKSETGQKGSISTVGLRLGFNF